MVPNAWKLSANRNGIDAMNYYKTLVSKHYCGQFDLGYFLQEIGIEEVERVIELVKKDVR